MRRGPNPSSYRTAAEPVQLDVSTGAKISAASVAGWVPLVLTWGSFLDSQHL